MPVLMSSMPMSMTFRLSATAVLITFRLKKPRHDQKMVTDGQRDPGDSAAEDRREEDAFDNTPGH